MAGASGMESGEVVAGRYRVERELGRGGMGAVFVARDVQREREVALKVVSASGHAQDEVRARFDREAAIGCALGQERGFVRCFEWGALPHGRLYLVMDLVRDARPLELRAGSLQERLERLERAARLVARAHALGVVHRDLKPANFLVDPGGEVWLTDFGLAKLDGDAPLPLADVPLLTRTGMAMGTPTFMPPEQFEDARAAAAPADVYALGVMLFHLLTGRYPYEGRSPTEVMSLQLKTKLGERHAPRAAQLEVGIPPALDALCAEALDLDPARRPARGQVFLERLQAARRDPRGAGVVPSLATFAGPRPVATAAPATTPPLASGVEGSLLTAPPRPVMTPLPARPFTIDWALELGRALRLGWSLPFLVALGTGLQLVRVSLGARAGPPREAPPPRLAQAPASEPDELAAVHEAAKRGDVGAMLELAERHWEGDEVELDRAEAIRWYRSAANHGDAEAMLILGELHLDGEGVAHDEHEARRWFARAAAAGSSDAEMHLIALEQWNEAERAERDAERRSAREARAAEVRARREASRRR